MVLLVMEELLLDASSTPSFAAPVPPLMPSIRLKSMSVPALAVTLMPFLPAAVPPASPWMKLSATVAPGLPTISMASRVRDPNPPLPVTTLPLTNTAGEFWTKIALLSLPTPPAVPVTVFAVILAPFDPAT